MNKEDVKTRFFKFNIIKNKEINSEGEVEGLSSEFKEYRHKGMGGQETLYITELKGVEYQIICEGIYSGYDGQKARQVILDNLPLILS